MPLPILSPREIDHVAATGDALWRVLGHAVDAVHAGHPTRAVADAVRAAAAREPGLELVLEHYRQPSDPAAAPAYPAPVCVCINDEVVHAVPGDRAFQEGDLVTIDLAVRLRGWCADAARSLVVGPPQPPRAEPARLLVAAQAALATGIRAARAGRWWSEVAADIRAIAGVHGVRLVHGFEGHGIGRTLHEPPRAPLTPTPRSSQDFRLRPGLVLAIEPIVTLGGGRTRTEPDTWTVRTTDARPACFEERTVAITRGGPRVLTGADAIPSGGLGG